MVMTLRITAFLDFDHHLVLLKNLKRQHFENWVCLHPQVDDEIPTLFNPLYRANPSHQTTSFGITRTS
jgi:hypothetical protein